MHRNVRIRIYFTFFEKFSTSLFSPFAVVYFASAFGTAKAGFMMISLILVSMLGNSISGSLSDIKGRKDMLVWSDLLRGGALVLGAIIYLFLYPYEILIYFLLLLTSLGGGVAAPILNSTIIEVTNEENRKKVFAIIYWLTNMGLFFGVLIGGIIYEKYFIYSILVCGILYSIIGITTSIFFEETITNLKEKPTKNYGLNSNFRIRIYNVRKYQAFFTVTFSIFFITILENQLLSYLGVKISTQFDEIHFLGYSFNGVSILGFLQAENNFIVVIGSLIVLKYILITYNKYFLSVLIVLLTIGYFLLAYSNSLIIILLSMLIISLIEVIIMPVFDTVLSKTMPKDHLAKFSALHIQIISISMVVSTSTTSLSAYLDHRWMAYIFLIIGGIGGSLFCLALFKYNLIDKNEVQKKIHD